MSKGYCVPYTPLLYTPLLWARHAVAMRAPAPAPANGGGRQDGPASAPIAPGPPPGAAQLLALGPGRSSLAGRTAGIESAGAGAMPAKAPIGQSGQRAGLMHDVVELHAAVQLLVEQDDHPINCRTAADFAIMHAGTPSAPLPQAAASAPTAGQLLPADLHGLADGAAGATLGASGSHVLLVSVTTAGGFCVVALVLAAVVFCILRRRGKQHAYIVERKPSQASMGSSGHEGLPKPSPLQTTPKGLRQAYAKAAGLHQGETSKHISSLSMTLMTARASAWALL